MSLEGSIKENIDELIYEAIETIRGKKHKTSNEFSICNYLNVNTDKDKDFIECRIRYLLENGKLKNKPKNGVNSYFKIYSTDPAILNDSDFSNKSNENIGNDPTGTQSNEDLIEALKSKLLDEIMPYIKVFIKEELKFSKQENDLVNSNTEIIKSLEKELEFLKQELLNKNKLIELYTSKIFGNGKDNGKGSNFDLESDLSTLNSKLVDETIISCSNILNSSVSETVNCGSNISTPQISEEYDQRKNVKKKLNQQLADVRKQLHENCNSFKSNNELLHYHNKTSPTTITPWAKGTTLIAGDSMLHEIDENRLSEVKPNSVEVRIFRGASIDDMKVFLKPYLKRSPTNTILHVGTNNSINDSSSAILNKLVSLKNFIHAELHESNVILSNIINRSDNGIARLKISNFNKHLNSLKIDTIDNGNISSEHLNGSGLHLNRHGKGKLAMNLIKKLRELRRRKFNKN